eukprot:m.186078 g.186078  ORF g.186078 m.186078 type:complete len:532 (-) comp18129_c0_seq2:131-1726(-)
MAKPASGRKSFGAAAVGTGVTRIGQYVLQETLGTGSFGKVKRAEHAITGHVVAVKILNREKVKSLDMVAKIKREIQILKMFRHPHIIKLYQVISSATDIFLVMEYVSGGELFEYILKHGKLSEKAGRKFFQQIVSGVDYCHRHMVVHRDLKPENLLLDDKLNVKIADFGLSNIMSDGDFLKTSCGSPNYAAPEVISGHLYAGPEVDVWSCGVILYVLLCGKLPFDDEYVPYLFKKIKSGIFSVPPTLSSEAQTLVKAMLRVDPLKRATLSFIKEHPWFQVDLPDYISHLFQSDTLETQSDFDEEAISIIRQRFQMLRDHVIEALRKRDATNQVVVAYDLILDNKRIAAHGQLVVDPKEKEVSDIKFLDPSQSHARPGSPAKGTSAAVSAPLPRHVFGGDLSNKHMTKRLIKRSRWHLGMRSGNNVEDIMAEVYRAMQALNFQWKVVTPYHARCRTWNQVSGTMMKMSLKLYKADERNFLLDFQNLPVRRSERLRPVDAAASVDDLVDDADEQCHTMEFFELCAMLIIELGR